MFNLIIYDFDMTLVDSRTVTRKVLHDVGESFGFDLDSITEEDFWKGTFRDAVDLIYKIGEGKLLPEDIKRTLVKSAIRRYGDQQLNEIETLIYLQDRNILQAIVSQNVLPIMNACLQNENNRRVIFDPIYSCDGATKPARIEQIVSGIGFLKARVLYVGDRPEDIEAGKEVRVRTVAVPTGLHSAEILGRYNPDYLFPTLTGLRNLSQP